MLSLGPLAFLNPWVLTGLAALPVLWWLLRAIPPSPRTQVFAGVRLLLGLEDDERQTHKTPWWLLLIRCLAVAAAILGFSQPVSNLAERFGGRDGTLLLIMDQGWASAPDWSDRINTARAILDEAANAGRDVIFWRASEGDIPPSASATAAQAVLDKTEPRPWHPDHGALLDALQSQDFVVSESVWLNDGLARDGTEDLLGYLADLAPLRLIGPELTAKALTPPRLEDGVLRADVLSAAGDAQATQVIAYARAEQGGERRIAVAQAVTNEAGRAVATFDLPVQLQATVTRIVLADRPSAGGAAFADGAIDRVSAALIAAETGQTVTTLVSPTHYVEKALVPWADLTNTDILRAIETNPAVIILSDHGDLPENEHEALTSWVDEGGLLIRFAGPRLASSIGAQGLGAVRGDDPLIPVRLRRGGRFLGGALAWSTPRALGPFAEDSPFRRLMAPDEVAIRTQVLAEPSPDLAGKVWASLDDGTPLVTASALGTGQVVLFHVSADAEWSSLPLSGLFVEMLGRLMALAHGRSSDIPDAEELADTIWRAETLMGIDGSPKPASEVSATIAGERFSEGSRAEAPPGIYARAEGGATAPGDAKSLVINLTSDDAQLLPFPAAPSGVSVETLGGALPERYGPRLLALAIFLVVADILGTLVVSGRMTSRARAALPALVAVMLVSGGFGDALAQDRDQSAIESTAETTLGYLRTGDTQIDRVSERGLIGLGNALAQRTAIEPGPPKGVEPGVDELSFYPVLYWPLTAETVPGANALEAIAAYLTGGGLLIIDTQNGASGFGGASAIQMREIARALNLPPLAPVDNNHVLTRTFYLLDTFPGRWRGGRVWTEAPPPGREITAKDSDIPQFDRVDDNVSPVIVGSADWAAAWAIDDRGYPLFAIGRPGDRQRELALRFGVNAVMYALTGNYKSDQVHAPAVLQRLGQ